MKKIIALALALIMVLGMSTVAFAANALPTPDANSVITLTEDVELTATAVFENDVTIDLNGYNITAVGCRALHVKKGTLTLTGTGTITAPGDCEESSVIRVGSDETDSAGLVVEKNVTVFTNTQGCYGITYFGKNDQTVTINGKVNVTGDYAALSGNGSPGLGTATVTVNGEVTALKSNAIYKPEGGTLTINGKVTGLGGVEVKSGTLVVGENAVITATGTPKHEAKPNNCSTSGYAVAAVKNTNGYSGNVKIIIEKGTFDGLVDYVIDTPSPSPSPDPAAPELKIKGGTFTVAPPAKYVADNTKIAVTTGATNPGNKVVVAINKDRTTYKVKGYDFTTGTEGYKGASYIDEVKIEKNGNVVIILKENYKLAVDKTIKGAIELYNKTTKTSEFIKVEYNVANKVHETAGERKPSEAILVPNGENQIILMDEDGGYVYFTEELLKGVVKMNKEEKTFLNVIYGGQEDTIDAIEELLGEEYLDEAIIEYYEFETRAFKNEVAFSYEAYEDDPHFFYLYNDGKLTKIDAKYNDDEEVEAWEWTAIAEGTIIVTDVEIVLADEITKNPDTGANDVVGVAAALAVVSLISAAAVSIKK